MQIQIEDVSPVEKKLIIEVPWDTVEGKLGKAYRELSRSVKLHGFRQGMVPQRVLEQMFGKRVRAEVVSDLVQEGFAAAVQEVFEWLRPRRTRFNRYKTNTELEVGRRAIIPFVVGLRYCGDGFDVGYRQEANLTALENVFSGLDGQGEIRKGYYSLLSGAIKQAGIDGRGETDYFRFRACRNGNLHLEFKRLDLLQRFNEIAGGARLRAES